MDLHVDLEGSGDLVTRLYRGLQAAITQGRLRRGDRLPSSRELARSLGVSRNSVAAAYERLVDEGFLLGRAGAGTFVADDAGPERRDRPRTAALSPRSGWHYRPHETSADRPRPEFDFRAGIPDGSLFPIDIWRRLSTATAGRDHDGRYLSPAGMPELRDEIVRYIAYSRGIRAAPDDVLITNGTSHSLDLVARIMIERGTVVAVEEPGYPIARDIFEAAGASVVAVDVDREGLLVEQLPDDARLVYTTPSHQFPLGTAMSLRRRRQLLDWAGRRDAAIFEDDYDSEFRFSQRPLEPLFSLDTDGRVIYAGTFSKTLLPTLRLGYVIAPESLRDPLRAARQLNDGHGQISVQVALQLLMSEGHLGRHIRRAVKVYGARRTRVLNALTDLDQFVRTVPSAAGLHVCARLRSGDPAAAEELVGVLAAENVALETLAVYCAGTPQAGVVIGYGATRSDALEGGLSILVDATRRVLA